MIAAPAQKARARPFILTRRTEAILKSIHFYRFVTALDVAHLLFSPKSLTHVRSILSSLSGGEDYKTNQYLYRFQLPTATAGNREKIYTLGSRGRDFLAKEMGLPVNWYFRAYKVKHFSYAQILHALLLTRFLVAAHSWSAKQTDFNLLKTRIGYELAGSAESIALAGHSKPGSGQGNKKTIKVIPDAWILFEKLTNGLHDTSYPILLEIDRGREYQEQFKRHVASRIEFITSGAYRRLFETQAVTIAYITTGEVPEYRNTRRRAMCAWTEEVLTELHKENWASIFRFHSLCLEEIYTSQLFIEPVWYRPGLSSPVPLFTQ